MSEDEAHLMTEDDLLPGERFGPWSGAWTTTTAGMTDAELGWAECEVRP